MRTYLHLYESFCRIVPPPEVVIYLRTSPEVAMLRVRERGRESERALTWEYMNRLHEAYTRWVSDMKTKTKVLTFQWDDFTNPGLRGVVAGLSAASVDVTPLI